MQCRGAAAGAPGELSALASARFDAGKPKDTPPTFLLCADNDRGPAAALPAIYLALKKQGVPVEMHIYTSGGHGFGLREHPRANPIQGTWQLRLADWLQDVRSTPKK